MNFKARELRFRLREGSQLDEQALAKALEAERFPGARVKSRGQESGVRRQESE